MEIIDNLEEIENEIQFMRGCEGNHTVKFYGSKIEEEAMWVKYSKSTHELTILQIAMEYCSLGSVRDMIMLLESPLTEEEISVICADSLRGLDYLHSHLKVHRDIKTDNILLNDDGEFKLADFGVSGELVGSLQKRNTVIGTPFFIAPVR
jgi:serine/threonine protein kinase